MIVSFRSKKLERFWWKGDNSKLDVNHLGRIARQLGTLDVADRPEGMNLPGWNFHALKGESRGRFAVKIDKNWRLTFAWSDRGAIDVDYEDYH